MIRRVCDKCGKDITNETNFASVTIHVEENGRIIDRTADLCIDCAKEMLSTLNINLQ